MVQAGIAGLDTPRTALGDATYLGSHVLDFDISQEQSFQSPSKDNNLVSQMQNGRRGVNIRTPRSRTTLGDRRNLPAGLGGGEFTPLLKNATMNSARRNNKENVQATPAFLRAGGLDKIQEGFSPLPAGSAYGEDSTRTGSYMAGTPMPHIDSSTASTPAALLPRRNEGPGVLQDGNQLSLREQENVIDRIEKENFGLKLKIHFLEEALRKAGPGFSEAALKENTELKVDKVTMQRELQKFRKTLTAAEKDVEQYRQQIMEMQEKFKRKNVSAGQQEELSSLRQVLEEKEDELNRVRSQEDKYADMENKIDDLEANLREKDRLINDREDAIENLKDDVEKHVGTISHLEAALKKSQRRAIELEEKAQGRSNNELREAESTIKELEREVERLRIEAGEAKEDHQEAIRDKERAEANLEELQDEFANKAESTIKELEREVERLRIEVGEAKEDHQEAIRDKERAEANLEELQDELANKSITTKGLSRQIEEKANRLQDDLEDLRERHQNLEHQYADKTREVKRVQEKLEDLKRDSEVKEQKLHDKLEHVENDLDQTIRERKALATRLESLQGLQRDFQQRNDEKNLLQSRHDALTAESAGLQADLAKAKILIKDLEDKLEYEKTFALGNERDVRNRYTEEIDRLSNEVEDLKAEIQDLHRLLRGSSEKRELATAKKTISRLEERILELASKPGSGDQQTDTAHELSEIKHDLTALRQKENEYIQRETTHKEKVKGLKRQIADLERKVHEADMARFNVASSPTSVGGSVHKEVAQLRHQLSEAHQSLKDLRSRMKESDKEAARKVGAMNINFQHQEQSWEAEKDQMERQLDELRLTKDELSARNASFEAAINRLSDKIDRLQKALMSERANSGEGHTIALERRDLHEMLQETQIQRESLELLIKERENAIQTVSAKEVELRSSLRRVRDERNRERARALSTKEQLELLEEEYVKSKEDYIRAKSEWEAEKRTLSRGVRFPNMSISYTEDEFQALKKEKEEGEKRLSKEIEKREERHGKELRGLCMQIEWMKARCAREESKRAELAYAKRYLTAKINMYDACNKADLRLLRQTSLIPEPAPAPKPKATIRTVAFLIIASVRMRKGAEAWDKNKKIHQKLLGKLEVMRANRAKMISSQENGAREAMQTSVLARKESFASRSVSRAGSRNPSGNPSLIKANQAQPIVNPAFGGTPRKSSLKSAVREILKERDEEITDRVNAL
ncbi:hypothetical protein DSL72_001564 [Monilinia vaccinii-corymbosi]|uniref:Centrosomin N-terminal motif 1 domain-containing protein n=1 Tax=Monilinia vaccinii-corymbosi TaxID=61207 RepID=A0A8A3P285_9HELO|nr:hypothetical protein DSL72_001564 [Monilinia vaccinii-corymbosi]